MGAETLYSKQNIENMANNQQLKAIQKSYTLCTIISFCCVSNCNHTNTTVYTEFNYELLIVTIIIISFWAINIAISNTNSAQYSILCGFHTSLICNVYILSIPYIFSLQQCNSSINQYSLLNSLQINHDSQKNHINSY